MGRNMSYCMFENTYYDLSDCYEKMDNPKSESEEEFFTRMIELCFDIVKDYGHISDIEISRNAK